MPRDVRHELEDYRWYPSQMLSPAEQVVAVLSEALPHWSRSTVMPWSTSCESPTMEASVAMPVRAALIELSPLPILPRSRIGSARGLLMRWTLQRGADRPASASGRPGRSRRSRASRSSCALSACSCVVWCGCWVLRVIVGSPFSSHSFHGRIRIHELWYDMPYISTVCRMMREVNVALALAEGLRFVAGSSQGRSAGQEAPQRRTTRRSTSGLMHHLGRTRKGDG